MLKGIDISVYQGTIGWELVKPNIDFAILRCGYGSDISKQDDVQFERNATECERLGIPYAVYLYSYANTVNKVDSEIQHVLRLVKGKTPFCIYYDMEDGQVANLGKTVLTSYAKRFCEGIKANGYKVGVYANENWFKNYLNVKELYDLGYSIWVAKYSVFKPKIAIKEGQYDIWQYTSKGKMDGIGSKGLDMNYMYNDIRNFKPIIEDNKLESLKKPEVEVKPEVVTPTTPTIKQPDTELKAGQAVKLNKTPLYASATVKNIAANPSGTYYLWSSEVINGRIRITNAASNAGKTGQVTGWINISDIKKTVTQQTTTPTPSNKPTNGYVSGKQIKLSKAPLYASSTTNKVSARKTGTYYLWDSYVTNGRIRITNAASNAGKTGQVTGWIKTSDIK